MEKSLFRRCAVASGLLTQADLDDALVQVAGSRRKADKVSDDRLAEWLIDKGRLNRWQVEQLRAGRTKFNLGRYHVVDSIGQGGMGQVFKAEDTVMGRIVAVKVLPRDRSNPESIDSFLREVRAQAQLAHENLVRAYDTGHDGNVHFLVTEYVPGTDLRRLVRAKNKLEMTEAASIISQAARGLGHAHQRGLIHRDVKPGNVLVTPEGLTKVSDLGLAGYFNQSEQTDAYGGKVVGTADYLAPEMITTPDKLTPASDIYSLGCTMYYAVTAKVPFPGGTARDKARAHCTQPPLDPRRLNPDLSDEFVEIIADMMAKEPGQRLQKAEDVCARLAPWVGTPLPGPAHAAVSAPLPPPITIPPVLRVSPSEMKDTEPYFLVQPAEDPSQVSSPSQLSVGTQPMAGASQETFPGLHESGTPLIPPVPGHWQRMRVRWHRLPHRVRVSVPLLLAGLLGAIVTAVVLTLAR